MRDNRVSRARVFRGEGDIAMIHAGKFANRLQRVLHPLIDIVQREVDEMRRNRVD